jgi:peptidoglycan/LPS O-acetylase OafA/YrhL
MKRLYSLDALRGVAALSVVLWHWQHFFAISGTWQAGWQRSEQPFYQALRPFYDAGPAAVDLFFAVSGFVFFWLYADAIAAKRVGGGKFANLRISRLYPLHLATLLAVAAMQLFFFRATGKYFIYDANDWQHFFSSLLMAQQWLPPTIVQSFNGPTWSVSVEMLLYAVFFAVAVSSSDRIRTSISLTVLGVLVFFLINEMIGRGLIGFFLGGLMYELTERIKERSDARRIALWSAALAGLAWIVVVGDIYFGPLESAYQWLTGFLPQHFAPLYKLERPNVLLLGFILTASPLTILALALHEQVLGGRYKRLSFLGDISYSSYLLHFPMQLGLALLALRLGWQPQAFMNGWALVSFYAVLIALSSASYHLFERPLQSLMRDAKFPVLFPVK